MERSNFDNVRLVESIFIQEPGKFPVEKSYFPALAVIKLNRLMTTEDNQITINDVFGGLLRISYVIHKCGSFLRDSKFHEYSI